MANAKFRVPSAEPRGAVLTRSMTAEEFDRHYFYADELRKFAKELGIRRAPTMKIALEHAIRAALRGEATEQRPAARRGRRDELAADSPIVRYVDDFATKGWLLARVAGLAPGLKSKSGQWYWLNDWRRTQLAGGTGVTYGKLAGRLAELMGTEERLPRIPSARFNNFVTDFLADPANGGASKADALAAWETIKLSPGPKTYEEFRVPSERSGANHE